MASVHPHACGEHFISHFFFSSHFGSSPRMWGTLFVRIISISNSRFIPTHVGNTTSYFSPSSNESVHPHACGEHIFLIICTFYFFGSSPRMWGTPLGDFPDRPDNRFIPTHVGNTHCESYSSLSSSVHPHACGEHAKKG